MPIDWNQTFASRTIAPPAPKPNLIQKAGNFISGAAKDAYSTLIATPATRIGQALVAPGILQKNQAATDLQNTNTTTAQMLANRAKTETNPTLKTQYQKEAASFLNNQSQPYIQAPDETNSNASGVVVPAQKTGLAGVEQIGGQGLKAASYLYGGEGLGTLSKTAGIGARALQGAKTFGIAGAAGNAGNAMEQGGNFGQVAGAAVTGGLVGAATGGVSAALHPIFTRSNSIMDPTDLAGANAARESASTGGVNAINEMNQTAQSDLTQMGQEFKQGAVNIENSNPEAGMDITKPIADQLKTIKENAKFALPDFVANKDWTIATPTQAQDLITQLNRATFQAKTSGEFAVNQQLIDLTNQIKDQASQAFGPEWDQIYSNYSGGRSVLDKLDGIVNLDKNASPADLNKQLAGIQELGSTPEGQKFLQQAVEQYKAERGIDLTDPVGAVNQILKAQGQLKIAQKGSYGQQLIEALKSPNLAARRVAAAAVTILGITAAGTAFRKQIGNFISGQ